MRKLHFFLVGLLTTLMMRAQVDSIFINGNSFVYQPPVTWRQLDKQNGICSGDSWNSIYAHPVAEKCANATIAFRFERYPQKSTGAPGKIRLRKPDVRAGFKDIQGHHGIFFATELETMGCPRAGTTVFNYNAGYQFWISDTTRLFFIINTVCAKEEENERRKTLEGFAAFFFSHNERSLSYLATYRQDTPLHFADSIPVGASFFKFMIPEGWTTYKLYNDPSERNDAGRKLQLRTAHYEECGGGEITMVLKKGSPLAELMSQDPMQLAAAVQQLSEPDKADTVINGLSIVKRSSVYKSDDCKKAFTAVTQYTIAPVENGLKNGWYFTITVTSAEKDLFTAIKEQEAFEQFIRLFIQMNNFDKFKKGL